MKDKRVEPVVFMCPICGEIYLKEGKHFRHHLSLCFKNDDSSPKPKALPIRKTQGIQAKGKNK